ncbi:3789_t:CDS:2, partial [Funneliformis mosseae]
KSLLVWSIKYIETIIGKTKEILQASTARPHDSDSWNFLTDMFQPNSKANYNPYELTTLCVAQLLSSSRRLF